MGRQARQPECRCDPSEDLRFLTCISESAAVCKNTRGGSRWRSRTGIHALPRCHATLVAPRPKPYPKELKSLGDHVRRRRIQLGLLQKEAAKQIGASKASIVSWEMNRYEPATLYIPEIIRFLGYCPFRKTDCFGDWLKQCRTSCGLSQETLAGALAMDESTIAHWERGDHEPTQSSSARLKAFFATFWNSQAEDEGTRRNGAPL